MHIHVLEYLEQSCNICPDKIALHDEVQSIRFDQLKQASQSIGTAILKDSAQTIRKPIVVMVDRSALSIVACMGVLYSGNYYVPMDVKTPKKRLELLLETIQPLAILIAQKDEYILKTVNNLCKVFIIEEFEKYTIDTFCLSFIRSKIIDTDPVYAIFTSGSTGIPKGIVVSHRSVIDLAEWLNDTFSFSNKDILGNQTPFYFDASVKDIYICIRNQLTMHIIPKKLFMFPVKLIEYLNQNRITTILWATSAIVSLANSKAFQIESPQYIHSVFFAGEVMYAKFMNLWKDYLPHAKFVNLYGPTEITVDCTYFEVNREFQDDEVIPIGNACRNMEVFLLDEDRNHICINEPGEICIRGTGLALGYLHDPERSEEVFIQNPLHSNYRDLVYCSGDIGKYNEHGEIEFICRKDQQIKHMGNRLELGEIEAFTHAIPEVLNCICFYDQSKEKIVLFYSGDIEKNDLLSQLLQVLPKYMIPGQVNRIDEFPYNSNGKIDRKILLEMYKNETNTMFAGVT